MKKILIALFISLFIFSSGETGRVVAQLYEGWSNSNDLYLVAFNGYYLPLIADDLCVGDHVKYYSINKAYYLGY